MYKKICECCGREFETKMPTAKFCSKKCTNEHNRDVYNGKRELFTKVCIKCGKEFQTGRSFQKLCSEKCRKSYSWTKSQPDTFFRCQRCGLIFDRKDNMMRRICPDCRRKEESEKEIRKNNKRKSSPLDNECSYIDRYGKKDVEKARFHDHLCYVYEKTRRELGIPTRQWDLYRCDHPDIVDKMQKEAKDTFYARKRK